MEVSELTKDEKNTIQDNGEENKTPDTQEVNKE